MKNDDAFDRFVREEEPGLRRALTGHLGREQVPDALAEAFAYAWQHRERVMQMENPSGYLYRVAQSKSRTRRQGWLEWSGDHELPDVEPGLAGALSAITAAVVGVILNLSIWFALHTLFRETVPVHAFPLDFDRPVLTSVDLPALVLAIAAATAIFRFKLGMLTVLAGSCAAGVALRMAGVI